MTLTPAEAAGIAGLAEELQALATIDPALVSFEITAVLRSLRDRRHECGRCGQPFIAKTGAKRDRYFCGDKCRKAASRAPGTQIRQLA